MLNLGSEINGLLNSVNSFIMYMAILEAGVGTATLQALYKPISDSDRNAINSIMSATNYFYKRTGYIYLALILLLSIAYTAVVDTPLPKFHVFMVVVLSGISGVMNYFFQGKYKILLLAEGKNYIITNITTCTFIGTSVTTKALLLINGYNVVIIQISYFLFNLIQMVFITLYIKRKLIG